MAAARATSIAGFAATSNVQAAHDYDIAATGTMAHSYIEAFAAESDAFAAFAQDFPDRLTFLIDTYDTLDGLRHALAVAERDDLGGGFSVRLDSGDLLELSVAVRKMLDIADRHDVSVVASGGLDEFDVKRLLDAGAPIDVFGVGTRVGVSADAPSLDSAYKLVEYDGRPVMKLSTGKETLPAPKQVYRSGSGLYDVLTMRSENALVGTTPLLIPVMLNGERLAPPEPLTTLSDRLTADLDQLSSTQRALDAAPPTPVRVSPALEALAATVRNEHRAAR
jgi:nicotinate phosphoribosyltransferase